MHAVKILASLCKDRDSYDRVSPYVGEDELGPTGAKVLEQIGEYYDRDEEAKSVDLEVLEQACVRGLLNEKHAKMYQQLLGHVAATDVSAVNVVHEVLSAKRDATGMKLSAALATNREQEIVELLDEYVDLKNKEVLEEKGATFNGMTIEDLFGEALSDDKKLKIAPKGLNDQLNGGLLRGQFLVLFARPEMGKSAMCITMIWGFLDQGLKVLYITNEDLPATLYGRMASAISGMTETQIRDNPQTAQERLDASNWGNLWVRELSPGTVAEISSEAAEVEPDVIIVDQLRNLTTRDDNKVVQLEENAKGLRQLAKKHDCVMIAVTQAGAEAEGKLVLTPNHIDGSKTGIPGACDVLVGMGADDQYLEANMRRLKLAKNKTGGGHGYLDISINPHLSRLQG